MIKRHYLTNPLYVIRRLNYWFYEKTHPHEPWIAQAAVRFCAQHLSSEGVGLEWGSGRSTAWFGQRLKSLMSIEHDAAWYERVQQTLQDQGMTQVDYRWIALDHPIEEPNRPHYEVTPAYVKVAEEWPDASLDFVVVDGHYRQACILAALSKLKPGGLLLVDNSNWLPLSEWGVPADWPIVHQSENVMTQTTIWQKPESEG